ncbi:MAG: isochorismate synthase DhbC [Bacillus sp. (in: firmicutes)]
MAVYQKIDNEQLFSAYSTGDFFLSSPQGSMLGEGVFITSANDCSKGCTLKERIQKMLEEAEQAGIANPIVAGAVPFNSMEQPRLVVPADVRFGPQALGNQTGMNDSLIKNCQVEQIPAAKVYKAGVKKAVEYIKQGELDKIVLGRTLLVQADHEVKAPALLQNLLKGNPNGYTFAVDLDGQGRKTLIGASPELLLSKRGACVLSNPLAGSRPRSNHPAEDERRAKELLNSAKDLQEHAIVVKAVVEALDPYCKTLDVPDGPSLISTETMWHLSTAISGELKNPAVTSAELAAALHPTPAVCGMPTNQAFERIKEIEPFDRELFTGIVGWCDAKGDGEWIVTIRCAELEGKTLRLFAGAGIVEDSDPEEEWKETAAKLKTVLRAMGLREQQEGEKLSC